MSMVAPAAFRDLSNDDEVRREVHSSFSDGHLSRSHVALLCGKLRAGVLAAVVRYMLCMAECGLPCSAIEANLAELHDGGVPVLHGMPSARRFFEDFVLPNRPVVIRSAVDSAAWPPLHSLVSIGYLRARCGRRRVAIKSITLHDSDGRPIFLSGPAQRLPLDPFLDAVESARVSPDMLPPVE